MTPYWHEVIKSDAYKTLSTKEKVEAQNEYFDTVVAPNVPSAEISAARQEFYSQYPLPRVKTKRNQASQDFSFERMIANAPESAMNWATDMWGGLKQMGTHPLDTAAAIGKMAVGGFQRAIPGKQEWEQQYFDPVAQMYSDKYGTWEQFKNTLESDPVGTVSDVAMIPGLAGTGLKAASVVPKIAGKAAGLANATRTAGTLGKVGAGLGEAGSVLARAGASLDPLNMMWNTTMRPLGRTAAQVVLSKDAPARLYSRAVKWPSSAGATDADILQLSETALREGIRPTTTGARKLSRLVKKSNDELNKMIKTATDEGNLINREALFRHFESLIDDKGSPFALSGAKNKKVINKIRQDYLDNLDQMYPGETLLTPEQVQKFKTSAYADLRAANHYANAGKSRTVAKKAAYEAAARGAKDELEVIAPGIDEVNKRAGELRALQAALPKPTRRLGNLNLMSLGTPLRVGSGAAIGGMMGGPTGALIGAGAGALAAGVDIPLVKMKTAEGLYSMLNNPIIDPRAKGEILPILRQTMAELQQLKEAGLPPQ